MVCCIAAAFVFGLFVRFFRKVLKRNDEPATTPPPPTPRVRVEAEARAEVEASGRPLIAQPH